MRNSSRRSTNIWWPRPSIHDAVSYTHLGRNFVSAAVNDKGETYIGVVLGAPWDAAEDGYAYSFHDTATIYDLSLIHI